MLARNRCRIKVQSVGVNQHEFIFRQSLPLRGFFPGEVLLIVGISGVESHNFSVKTNNIVKPARTVFVDIFGCFAQNRLMCNIERYGK